MQEMTEAMNKHKMQVYEQIMEAAAVAKENPVVAKKRTEEYLASRILGFEPGSIAGNRAKLEAVIQNDDSLSTEEKLLLILGLRV